MLTGNSLPVHGVQHQEREVAGVRPAARMPRQDDRNEGGYRVHPLYPRFEGRNAEAQGKA